MPIPKVTAKICSTFMPTSLAPCLSFATARIARPRSVRLIAAQRIAHINRAAKNDITFGYERYIKPKSKASNPYVRFTVCWSPLKKNKAPFSMMIDKPNVISSIF
jgi:hypothetical protein